MKRLGLLLAAAMLVAAGDPKQETEHVVEAGETLSQIAVRAGVPSIVIAEANGLAQPYRVRAGQRLTIPRQQSHTVKRGETSFAIAYRYGVTWAAIATANSLPESAALRPGQKLIIPALLTSPSAQALAPQVAAGPRPSFRRPAAGELLPAGRGPRTAVQFAAKVGDRIEAAAAGKVIFAADEPVRFGKLVVIDHGQGWHTAYGYLARTTVEEGDTVRAGERIGLAGQSGAATRPELHFEIRQGDKPVDPVPLLRPNGN